MLGSKEDKARVVLDDILNVLLIQRSLAAYDRACLPCIHANLWESHRRKNRVSTVFKEETNKKPLGLSAIRPGAYGGAQCQREGRASRICTDCDYELTIGLSANISNLTALPKCGRITCALIIFTRLSSPP